MLNFNGDDISLVSEPQEQIESSNNTQTSNNGGTLTMKKPFAGPSVSAGSSPTLTKEPQQLCVSSKVQTGSDDELEQFALQPRRTRPKNYQTLTFILKFEYGSVKS